MEQYLKRYFWVIHLVLVVAIAGLAAAAVGNVISGALSPLAIMAPSAPAPVKANTGSKSTGPSLAGIKTEAFKPPAKEDEKTDAPAEEPPEDEAPEEELALEGEYPISELNVTLTGTMVSNDPAWSMAMMTDGESSASFSVRTGETFLEGARLITVERERIIVNREGNLEQIEIGDQKDKKKRLASNKKSPSSRTSAPKTSAFSKNEKVKPASGAVKTPAKPAKRDKFSELRKGIKQVSDNKFEISKSTLQTALNDPRKFRDGTKVLPSYKGGKVQGFKVSGLKSSSIFSTLGVKSGDVITAVNGKPLNSANRALELYQKLGSAGNVSLQVERGGKSVTLDYNIK